MPKLKMCTSLCFPLIGSFIEVDAEVSNEAEFPAKCDEKMSDEPTLPEVETDRPDVFTLDLPKESDEVQLGNTQNVEGEADGKGAVDEWQDISLVTRCFLF